MTSDESRRDEFVREAARMYDEMMGRVGPETSDTFDDIERQARESGQTFTRALLEGRLAAEAEVDAAEVVECPECGRPMRRPKKPLDRNLETASGQVRYDRRHAICDCCQSSFSPSGPPTEDPI